jgi:hypothetical protein
MRGLYLQTPLSRFERADRTPHPALRATFSRKVRREGCSRVSKS